MLTAILGEYGPKFRVPEQGERLTQSLVTKHFDESVRTDQTVQVIIYEAKDGDLEGPSHSQTSGGGGGESLGLI